MVEEKKKFYVWTLRPHFKKSEEKKNIDAYIMAMSKLL